MSIEIETTITLAEVEVTDDYSVELRQRRRKVSYTPEEAVRLGAELTAAGMDAQVKLRTDLQTYAHAFDVAPICEECVDGCHDECDGTVNVNNGETVSYPNCGCAGVGHKLLGRVS